MNLTSNDNQWSYEPVPSSSQYLYQLWWQLESWIRTIVYVELRADSLDWEEPIKKNVREWPPSSGKNDKKLTHMVTPHQAASLSYLTFSELWNIISDQENWHLFSSYFPPKENVEPRIQELKSIRNRVAHFRKPHYLDVDRIKLFAQDMEPGIRRFCNRYTKACYHKKPSDDPVSQYLVSVWEQKGLGIELEHTTNWLYAPEPYKMKPKLHGKLERVVHDKHSAGSPKGVIYRLTISPPIQRALNVLKLLENTQQYHKDIIHFIVLNANRDVAITIPAIHNAEKTGELILNFLTSSLHCRDNRMDSIEQEKHKWPEYVLWPDHLLSLWNKNIKNSILQL